MDKELKSSEEDLNKMNKKLPVKGSINDYDCQTNQLFTFRSILSYDSSKIVKGYKKFCFINFSIENNNYNIRP